MTSTPDDFFSPISISPQTQRRSDFDGQLMRALGSSDVRGSIGGVAQPSRESRAGARTGAEAGSTAGEGRDTPIEVSGQPELIIPDCIVRVDATGVGIVESERSAEPVTARAREDHEELDATDVEEWEDDEAARLQAAEATAMGATPPVLQQRTRAVSQPTILVEDHELEEILEDVPEPPSKNRVVPPAPVQPAPQSAPPPPAYIESAEPDVPNWFDDFFECGEGPLVASGGEEEAVRDAEFVARCSGLSPGQAILDVGCGAGRHSFAFADMGFKVRGVERSERQLKRAAERNASRVRVVDFVTADMRSLPYRGEYDLVTCLGSTLGYFSDAVNRDCLVQMRDCLRTGGRLVLQCFNRDYVVGNVPCRSWWSDGGYLVLDEVDFDFVAERLRVKRTMLGESGRQTEHLISIRAYGLREMMTLLRSLGLEVLEYSGARGTRGYYYGADSPELWIVASRIGEA